jgi:biopolymer transport protein ExbD/biopolymer transport protein TolR
LQSGIQVDPPKTKTVKVISEEKVVITINKAQNIYIGNNPVNINKLGATVISQMRGERNQALFIRCDQAAPFGAFAMVLDALKQSRLTNINIVTEPLSTKGTS